MKWSHWLCKQRQEPIWKILVFTPQWQNMYNSRSFNVHMSTKFTCIRLPCCFWARTKLPFFSICIWPPHCSWCPIDRSPPERFWFLPPQWQNIYNSRSFNVCMRTNSPASNCHVASEPEQNCYFFHLHLTTILLLMPNIQNHRICVIHCNILYWIIPIARYFILCWYLIFLPWTTKVF